MFHLKCFTCFVCRKQLLTGEELYVVDDTKFVCKVINNVLIVASDVQNTIRIHPMILGCDEFLVTTTLLGQSNLVVPFSHHLQLSQQNQKIVLQKN